MYCWLQLLHEVLVTSLLFPPVSVHTYLSCWLNADRNFRRNLSTTFVLCHASNSRLRRLVKGRSCTWHWGYLPRSGNCKSLANQYSFKVQFVLKIICACFQTEIKMALFCPFLFLFFICDRLKLMDLASRVLYDHRFCFVDIEWGFDLCQSHGIKKGTLKKKIVGFFFGQSWTALLSSTSFDTVQNPTNQCRLFRGASRHPSLISISVINLRQHR